ncbi:MAG: hypothetical protein U0800_20175 [Isosphaeraceae bacterium]
MLSIFPLSGTFSGSYSTRAAEGGIGRGQDVSGTITITIDVTSVRAVGGGYSQAFITGTASQTGFVGGAASYPYSGSVTDQGRGVETGFSSSESRSTNEIVITAYVTAAPMNYITITGSCYNDSIVANVNMGFESFVTPNAAYVTLKRSGGGGGGGGGSGGSTAAPTHAGLVKPRKGPEKIVVDFSGQLAGSGLPLANYRLTAGANKKHAKVVPLARVAYDSGHHTATLTLRNKLAVNGPLKLTISGLAGGPATISVARR